MKVLAISGSLRRDSHNTKLQRAAQEILPPPAQLVIYDGLKDVPPYDEDDDVDPAPEPVRRLRDAIADADAVLIATPEYNASIPGQLKNALDWASRPFPGNALHGKPVAVIGASTSMFGAAWAQAELRKVLGAIGARVLDRDLPISLAEEAFDAQFQLVDDEHRARLEEILGELLSEAYRNAALRGNAALAAAA
jgi:chromate reductase, NAD(P)H dehydrogenase (quinone)